MNIQDTAILFDLDGVVFSSENYYTDFWTMEAKKYLPHETNFAQLIKGHGLNDIFRQYFNGKNDVQQEIIKDLKEVEANMDFVYIKGVQRFLEHICSLDLKRCLVTSSMNDKMEHVFKKHPEMKKYFPLIVTASDIEHAKPSPDCYIKASSLCNTPADRCIVFEDSIAGMQAAHSAGMQVIGLATTLKREEIMPYAHAVIDNFENMDTQMMMKLSEQTNQ
ncbi:MAG: HAD family phosphatase [Bacteroidales bacterium]|nr:HAD family phosphatase [Bacteroidales bacterium]